MGDVFELKSSKESLRLINNVQVFYDFQNPLVTRFLAPKIGRITFSNRFRYRIINRYI